MLYIYYIPIYYKPYIKKDFSKANNKSLYFVFVLMALQTSECKENKQNKTDIYKILHCVLESKGCAESELIWRRFALLNLCYNKLSRLKSECWDDCAVQSVVLQLTQVTSQWLQNLSEVNEIISVSHILFYKGSKSIKGSLILRSCCFTMTWNSGFLTLQRDEIKRHFRRLCHFRFTSVSSELINTEMFVTTKCVLLFVVLWIHPCWT